ASSSLCSASWRPCASRSIARRPFPTSSPISSTGRSAPTRAAASPSGFGRRCRACFPWSSTAASTTGPLVFSTTRMRGGGRSPCPSAFRSATSMASISSGSTAPSAPPGLPAPPKAPPASWVRGLPSNNLNLYGFIRFVLDAGVDERLKPDRLIPAMQAAGANLGVIDQQVWRLVVIPRMREGFIERRSRLQPFLADQQPWGPGRGDTFNPYKLVQMDMLLSAIAPDERHGASDFPSIFNQRPREGMQLHWDGNNSSLDERNLSAALGAGVTPETVDHAAIKRVKEWLLDLHPPRSPHQVDPAAAERGRGLYMNACAVCHGYQGPDRYVFQGAKLGTVEPNSQLGTDPGRLDSYTEAFRQRQLAELFAGTPFQFKHFVKTNGYANMPLDALWLRGPYLHNGSVPTLRDLLAPPAERPPAFVRGIDIIDGKNGGFLSLSCTPGRQPPQGFCYDTRLPGNGN